MKKTRSSSSGPLLKGHFSNVGKGTEAHLDMLRRQLGIGVDPWYDYSALELEKKALLKNTGGKRPAAAGASQDDPLWAGANELALHASSSVPNLRGSRLAASLAAGPLAEVEAALRMHEAVQKAAREAAEREKSAPAGGGESGSGTGVPSKEAAKAAKLRQLMTPMHKPAPDLNSPPFLVVSRDEFFKKLMAAQHGPSNGLYRVKWDAVRPRVLYPDFKLREPHQSRTALRDHLANERAQIRADAVLKRNEEYEARRAAAAAAARDPDEGGDTPAPGTLPATATRKASLMSSPLSPSGSVPDSAPFSPLSPLTLTTKHKILEAPTFVPPPAFEEPPQRLKKKVMTPDFAKCLRRPSLVLGNIFTETNISPDDIMKAMTKTSNHHSQPVYDWTSGLSRDQVNKPSTSYFQPGLYKFSLDVNHTKPPSALKFQQQLARDRRRDRQTPSLSRLPETLAYGPPDTSDPPDRSLLRSCASLSSVPRLQNIIFAKQADRPPPGGVPSRNRRDDATVARVTLQQELAFDATAAKLALGPNTDRAISFLKQTSRAEAAVGSRGYHGGIEGAAKRGASEGAAAAATPVERPRLMKGLTFDQQLGRARSGERARASSASPGKAGRDPQLELLPGETVKPSAARKPSQVSGEMSFSRDMRTMQSKSPTGLMSAVSRDISELRKARTYVEHPEWEKSVTPPPGAS